MTIHVVQPISRAHHNASFATNSKKAIVRCGDGNIAVDVDIKGE